MKRFCFKEKKDIIDGIHSISNDVMINSLIEDLINHDGVTNFFWSENGCTLINEKNEMVKMFINPNSLQVSSDLDNSYHEINYFVCSDQSRFINYILKSKVDWPDYTENRTLESITKYNSSGNLVYSEKVKTSYLSSNDSDLKDNLEKIKYENYKYVTREYLVDDRMIRVCCSQFFYDSNINDISYYMGMINSSGSVEYYPISYEKFMEYYSTVVDDNFVKKMKIFK